MSTSQWTKRTVNEGHAVRHQTLVFVPVSQIALVSTPSERNEIFNDVETPVLCFPGSFRWKVELCPCGNPFGMIHVHHVRAGVGHRRQTERGCGSTRRSEPTRTLAGRGSRVVRSVRVLHHVALTVRERGGRTCV